MKSEQLKSAKFKFLAMVSICNITDKVSKGELWKVCCEKAINEQANKLDS